MSQVVMISYTLLTFHMESARNGGCVKMLCHEMFCFLCFEVKWRKNHCINTCINEIAERFINMQQEECTLHHGVLVVVCAKMLGKVCATSS